MGNLKQLMKSSLTDDGVLVSELLELLDLEDELTINLLDVLKIKDFESDFVEIQGARTLVETQKGINNRYYKEDIISSLENISIRNEEEFMLLFHDIESSEYFSNLNLPYLATTTMYSSRNDFFSWYYGIDKYASELIKNGLIHILDENIELLKQNDIGGKERKYRILYDKMTDKFSVRAIISLDRYNNYDNNITIVIALLSLHRKMKEKGGKYSLNRVEYNESYLRLFIEEGGKRRLQGDLGYVKNIIEVSNDEVKREALKFDAICNIEFIDSENNLQELIIQPLGERPKVQTNILALSHSTTPKKFAEKLDEIDNSIQIHNDLYNLIDETAQIKNPLEIIHLVRRRVDSARNENFKKYKNKIQKMLESQTVTNMIQLLTLFKKMELITETDLEANEYIRYITYRALIERKH